MSSTLKPRTRSRHRRASSVGYAETENEFATLHSITSQPGSDAGYRYRNHNLPLVDVHTQSQPILRKYLIRQMHSSGSKDERNMNQNERRSNKGRRSGQDRRSGVVPRSDEERKEMGERGSNKDRRSGLDRRSGAPAPTPKRNNLPTHEGAPVNREPHSHSAAQPATVMRGIFRITENRAAKKGDETF
jgi:hypothetical protein